MGEILQSFLHPSSDTAPKVTPPTAVVGVQTGAEPGAPERPFGISIPPAAPWISASPDASSPPCVSPAPSPSVPFIGNWRPTVETGRELVGGWWEAGEGPSWELPTVARIIREGSAPAASATATRDRLNLGAGRGIGETIKVGR